MSVRGAAFLGIGAMVGAGIFALLGEAGTVAGSAVWLSFLLAGIVAALLGYNVVKLGVRYPSSGGLIAYLLQGFGNGRLVGIASWLGYFAAIVIVCAMVAVAFGSYATSLFVGDDAGAAWDNIFTSAVVIGMAGISLVGARFVDRVHPSSSSFCSASSRSSSPSPLSTSTPISSLLAGIRRFRTSSPASR